MKKFSVILSVFILFFIITNYASAQQPELATFQEISQVIIDQKISNEIIASVTLQTTSNQEMRIPSELEGKILDEPQIITKNGQEHILGSRKKVTCLCDFSFERDPGARVGGSDAQLSVNL